MDKHISDLSCIKDKSIQKELVNNSKVKYSESNIVEYVKDTKALDKSQIDFINSFNFEPNLKELELNDEIRSSLFKLFVCCNELNNNKYANLLISLNGAYKNGFPIEQLTDDKINILIKNKIIYMSAKGLTDIRENYPNSTMLYIKTNLNEYADLIDSDNFDFNEMIEILSWDIDFSIKEKLLLLNQNKIDVCNNSYHDKVNTFILANDMYADNEKSLFEKFDCFEDESKKQILNIANNNISIVLSVPNASLNLIKFLIYNNLDNDDGLEMLLMNFKRFSKKEVIDYLVKLGYPKYSEILNPNKHPRFEINSMNERILQYFVDARYIYAFTKNNGYYSIQRKNPRKPKLFSKE